MEAIIRPDTGLLPPQLVRLALTQRDDGRWEATCELQGGAPRRLEFEADEQAEQRCAHALAQEFGFTDWAAVESSRRLFEPFALAAGWDC